MKRLSVLPGIHTRQACEANDQERPKKCDLEACDREKKQRQGGRLIQTRLEEAVREAE